MVLLRDTEGNFYEVADDVLEGKRVEPPLDDANFCASDYRWDPREDGASDMAGDATDVASYRWQPPAYRWAASDYRWHPPSDGGRRTSL